LSLLDTWASTGVRRDVTLTDQGDVVVRMQDTPPCRRCGSQMARRIRAPAQAALEAEFVCRNFDCGEVGIFKHVAVSSGLGRIRRVRASITTGRADGHRS